MVFGTENRPRGPGFGRHATTSRKAAALRPAVRFVASARLQHRDADAEIDEQSAQHAIDPAQGAAGLPDAPAANAATARHQSVPLKMKIRPSSAKAAALCGESAATNCGRKARKNSATFGLSRLVSAPCRNTWRSEIAPLAVAASSTGACGRDSNILTPI